MLRTWSAALSIALCAGACGGGGGVDARSVVLITLDTTRADALSAWGGQRAVAPNLDALAEESVVYLQARSVTPLTLPAHASMFTGLYPPRHGVRGNGPATLSPQAETLAERAAQAGFQTAGFVGGLTLDRAYGAAQGFEAWSQPQMAAARALGQISDRPAEEVVLDARAWLASRDRGRPFFLWVHLFDPHAPYAAPPEFLERAGGDPYYAEVARMDAALGSLFDELRADGLFDSGYVCVVADHGEALGEHGEDTHGQHLWESTLRVPMFLRHPRAAQAGERRSEHVSVVDVAPTLAEAMRLPPLAGLDGLSLLDAVPPAERGVYFEALSGWARFRWSPLCGWADARGKYVHSTAPRLCELASDPNEERDLSAERPAEVAAAQRAIRAVLARPRLAPARSAGRPASSDAIAALGYGSTGEFEPDYPDPLEPSELPSPDARLDEYRLFAAAQSLRQIGRAAEAAGKLEELLRSNPRSVHALDELALALVDLERWPRAVEVLLERLKFPPDRLSTHQSLVKCYTALGDDTAARLHTERALELLIESHERRGESQEAQRYRQILESAREGR